MVFTTGRILDLIFRIKCSYDYLKGTGPGVIFLIAVTFIAVWISAFIHPSDVSASQFDSDPMPLYGLL